MRRNSVCGRATDDKVVLGSCFRAFLVVLAAIGRLIFGDFANRRIVNWRADFVQEIGRHVRAVVPHDGVNVGIQASRAEPFHLSQRFKHLAFEMRSQVNPSTTAVLKGQEQTMPAFVLDISDVVHVFNSYANGSMGRNGFLSMARFQSVISAARCNDAHSKTNPVTRGGNEPSSSLKSSIANDAL